MELQQLTDHWAALATIPTVENANGEQVIDTSFLHFAQGDPVEQIWHWFEAQHPNFSVAAQQGIAPLYMAMEFYGDGDPYFGGTANDRVLCENGLFLDECRAGIDSPKKLSLNRDAIEQFAQAAANRREGGKVSVFNNL